MQSLEKAAQQLRAELAAEKSQCAKLQEEVAALHKEKTSAAQAGQSESAKAAALQKQVEMLTAEKAALDGKLEIERRSLSAQDIDVTVTRPDGRTETVRLKDIGRGRATASLPAVDQGLYRVSDGTRDAFAALGEINSREFNDPRASALPLQPLVTASGGGVAVLPGNELPDLRRVGKKGDRSGNGWFGLTRNEDFVVTGVSQAPMLPPWAETDQTMQRSRPPSPSGNH